LPAFENELQTTERQNDDRNPCSNTAEWRPGEAEDGNLASAIRLFVICDYQRQNWRDSIENRRASSRYAVGKRKPRIL
jgi:hypothetical protein